MTGVDGIVVASPENADGTRCVDIVRAADGSFAFSEWRRDPEDPSGWRATGAAADGFVSAAAARAAACEGVAWLAVESAEG